MKTKHQIFFLGIPGLSRLVSFWEGEFRIKKRAFWRLMVKGEVGGAVLGLSNARKKLDLGLLFEFEKTSLVFETREGRAPFIEFFVGFWVGTVAAHRSLGLYEPRRRG